MALITKKEIIPIGLILIMVLTGIGFYNSSCLPDKIATHWNAAGEVDQYSSKNFILIFYPAFALLIYLLMTFIPAIDPLRKNYDKFRMPYYFIRLAIILFLALLYFYMIAVAFGFKLNIRFFIIPLLSLLFIGLGFAMPKIKRNWFAGIRTPWTLQSDVVWKKTHELAGKTFIIAGILTLFSILLPGELAMWAFLGIIIPASFIPMAYSYVVYKRLGLFKERK